MSNKRVVVLRQKNLAYVHEHYGNKFIGVQNYRFWSVDTAVDPVLIKGAKIDNEYTYEAPVHAFMYAFANW